MVSNANDIGVVPDVEPDEKTGDEAHKGIATELRIDEAVGIGMSGDFIKFLSVLGGQMGRDGVMEGGRCEKREKEREGRGGTYEEVGYEQGPLEAIPPELWTSSATFFTEPAAGDAVIIVVAFTRHPSLVASKSLSSTALFWKHIIDVFSMLLSL